MLEELKKDLNIQGVFLKNFINLDHHEMEMVLNWRNSEQIRNNMYSNEEIKWEDHVKFITNLEENNTRLHYLAFINQQPIGAVYFTDINLNHKRGIFGIFLRPDGNHPADAGIKLKDVILELAFKHLDFNTLNSEVLSENMLAYIYNKKAGFKEEGRLRSYIKRQDKTLDVILFGMLKTEYLEKQK